LPKKSITAYFDYIPSFLSKQEAGDFFSYLQQNVPWEQGKIKLFGKKILEPRLSAFYADSNVSYNYSNRKLSGLSWPLEIDSVKRKIETLSGQYFNTCLINRYRNGRDSMGWHSDNEKELGPSPIIASLNLGETRDFQIKSRVDSKEKLQIQLNNGDLLIMKAGFQENFLHQIPKRLNIDSERINLTFRKVLAPEIRK
jgi:alkylated DNA repair dioxygenase AlkB